MTIFLDRIDSVPVLHEDFDYQLLQWFWVLVDTLNETLGDLQGALNLLTAQSYTATEITALESDGLITNGVLLYDSTNNVYVGMQSGSLVQFTTSAYP